MTGTYVEGGLVHLSDLNGVPAEIPARHLYVVAHAANQSDEGTAQYGRHRFDRDALNGARDLLDGLTDTCTADGCEDAAPFSLRDARPRCASHAKED